MSTKVKARNMSQLRHIIPVLKTATQKNDIMHDQIRTNPSEVNANV